MAKELGYTMMDSPIGPLLVASTEEGLCYIQFANEQDGLAPLVRWCKKTFVGITPTRNDAINEPAKIQLEEYFAGKRKTFDVPTVLYGTPFQKSVWNELSNIPLEKLVLTKILPWQLERRKLFGLLAVRTIVIRFLSLYRAIVSLARMVPWSGTAVAYPLKNIYFP
ncbi:hypothetical protein YSY22_50250 [Brevibacillus formosus]